MNISELSIRKPVFAWMLMAGLIVFGWICFSRMGVSQMPDVDFPVVNISVTLEGAAPEVMELNVVEPIEEAVIAVQGIKSITSSSRTGRANVTVEFNLNKDIDIAVQEIQTVIAQAARRLPDDVDPPVVSKSNPEDQPILWLAVLSNKMNDRELMTFVRERIKDRFSTVEGVGEITLGGYIDPNLRVSLSSEKLTQYALSVTDIINTIQAEHSELPSGRIEQKDREINVRTMGEAHNPEEFGTLPINRRGGSPNFVPIALGQVATIEEGLADVRRKSRAMGKSSIGLGIRKQRGSNAVEVARQCKLRMEEIKKSLPEGTEMSVNFDATQFIEEAVHELNFTLVLSALLTAVVCWMFLGSFSATMNVILAIPTSVVGAFIALYAMGFTLNTFTLLGLSLAIGIVVDDAIMVLENIVRHKEMGKSRVVASLDGSREITFAALAATAAVIAIFLPVAFMDGIIGKYFYQFGVTLSVAVALSLLEALTLAPMRCSQFLDVSERRTFLGRFVEAGFRGSERLYHRSLGTALRFRWVVLVVAFAIFGASMLLVKNIEREFVPSQDQSRLMVRVTAPIGSSLDFTDRLFLKIEEVIKADANIERYFASIGGFGGGEVDTGMIFLTLKAPDQRLVNSQTNKKWTQKEIADDLRGKFRGLFKDVKGVKAFVQDLSLSGFSAKRGFPIEFTIRGPEWDTLISQSQSLMEAMGKTGLMTDIDSDYRAGMPEIQIIPDRVKARLRGVSVVDINQTVNALIGGVVVGKYSKGNYRYDIRVRLVAEERMDEASIAKLKVRNNRGELISLSEVVTLKEEPSLQTISHQDRERAISVFANVASGASQQKAIDEVTRLANSSLPDGYRAVVGGSAQTFQESGKQLMIALILGIVVAYMILASQFNSFIHPVTVLLALPFSLTGAFVSLVLAGKSLNIFSAIGIILLMGLVKKNSILLVDFTNQMRDRGMEKDAAILAACPVRLRPILMTSIATIVGAIPPALAIGPGAESRVPMALVVIGGMIVSTALTLFVVPCFYSIVSPKNRRRFEEELAAALPQPQKAQDKIGMSI